MRVVIDTNVWVSGMGFPDGPPGKILAAARKGLVQPLASWKLAEEIVEVLRRPRIQRLGIGEWHVMETLVLLGTLLPDVEVRIPLRDPDDLVVVASAFAGAADAIVTGDTDLLDDAALRALLLEKGIEVLTPAELLSRL